MLWRRKEAFSDGVSTQKESWFEMIQKYAKEKYKDGFPKPPFLAKKSRRGIRAYLEPDLQWYHQKRNALEVLETFQLMQEEEDN